LTKIAIYDSLQLVKHIISINLLFIMTFFAFIIRVNPILTERETRRNGMGPYADPGLYHLCAFNLISGNGFSSSDNGQAFGIRDAKPVKEYKPVIFRGPGYPLFLALVYHCSPIGVKGISADDWSAKWDLVRMVQALIDSSLCIAVFILIRLLYPPHLLPAFIGALLQCFNAFTIHYSRTLLSETLTGFLIMWGLVFFIAGLTKWSYFFLPLSGLFSGFLMVTRPEYILWTICLLLSYFFIAHNKSFMKRLFHCCIVVLCAGLFVIPWTYRNYKLFDRLIIVSAGNLGELLHRGTFEGCYPWKGWRYCPRDILHSTEEQVEIQKMYSGYISAQMIGGEEVFAYDEYFFNKALTRLNEKPCECIKAWVRNIPRLWFQQYIQMYIDREPSGNFILIYFLFFVIALVLSPVRTRCFMLPIILLVVFLTFLYLPLHIEPRYSVPALPAIIAMAGLGVGLLIQYFLNVFKHVTAPLREKTIEQTFPI
jgi:hypothetical protein